MAENDEEASTTRKSESTDRLDPWVEDGNIVLAVEGKYFRVHRSMLSAYSEVFKDMFACSELNEGEKERIEGCPVVHLHDAVNDVQMVLKAMYDRSYPLPYYEKAPLSVVAAFLRLGEKYTIRPLLNEAKGRLCCAFETKLRVASTISSSFTVPLFPGITDTDPRHFQVMNLLREMDLQAPLPLAMYQCVVACPLNAVVDGYKFNGVLCTLSLANLRSFILVKHTVESLRVRLAQCLGVSGSCVVQSTCRSSLHRLWSDEATIAQPFGQWRQEWDKLFCDMCRRDLNTWRNVEIQKAWNLIPTAFGFSNWADLAKSGDFPSCTK